MVRSRCFHGRGPGSIRGQGTKTLQAVQCNQKKKNVVHLKTKKQIVMPIIYPVLA